MRVPMVNLGWQYDAIRESVEPKIVELLRSGRYIMGEPVVAFERQLAAYVGTSHAVSCACGTDALVLALRACGVGPGDHVITVPNSFVATAHAIVRCGAEPVFVDVDETHDMDPSLLAGALTKKTKAIVPVHLYGQSCDMRAIMDFAREHALVVVEDCAQAIGADFRGQKVGSFGDAGCFSFFPTKPLGCAGDGGAVVTNDATIAQKVDRLRRHGFVKKNDAEDLGLNSRLDALQALVLSAKLEHLDEWNAERCRLADRYKCELSHLVRTPGILIQRGHVYYVYVVEVDHHRDQVRELLARDGVETQVHPERLITDQPFYAIGPQDRWPSPSSAAWGDRMLNARRAAGLVLCLPIHPGMTGEEQSYVIDAVKKALVKARA